MKNIIMGTVCATVLTAGLATSAQAVPVDLVFSNTTSGDSITYTVDLIGSTVDSPFFSETTYLLKFESAIFNIGGVVDSYSSSNGDAIFNWSGNSVSTSFGVYSNPSFPGAFDNTMVFDGEIAPVTGDIATLFTHYLADDSYYDSTGYIVNAVAGSYLLTGDTTSYGLLEMDRLTYGDAALSQVPVPAAVWLFASGALGLVGLMRRRQV